MENPHACNMGGTNSSGLFYVTYSQLLVYLSHHRFYTDCVLFAGKNLFDH